LDIPILTQVAAGGVPGQLSFPAANSGRRRNCAQNAWLCAREWIPRHWPV